MEGKMFVGVNKNHKNTILAFWEDKAMTTDPYVSAYVELEILPDGDKKKYAPVLTFVFMPNGETELHKPLKEAILGSITMAEMGCRLSSKDPVVRYETLVSPLEIAHNLPELPKTKKRK